MFMSVLYYFYIEQTAVISPLNMMAIHTRGDCFAVARAVAFFAAKRRTAYPVFKLSKDLNLVPG